MASYMGSNQKAAPVINGLTPIRVEALNREDMMNRLCHVMERYFGIAPNRQMATKLERFFAPMDSLAFTNRVNELISLPGNDPLWLALMEQLTVHETYFFRDEPQLEMLRRELLPQVIKAVSHQSSPRLRIWSAACSTGEEVYSLAMLTLDALLELGYAYGQARSSITTMPGWQVEVLGCDLSADVLRTASRANYAEQGMGSFRRMDARWEQWFEDVEPMSTPIGKLTAYRRPKQFVRKLCRFEQHNLMQSAVLFGSFDIVLCRNAMIYFNDENKCTVQKRLFDVLKPDGILLLGASDPLQAPQSWTTHQRQGLVYYTKRGSRVDY